MFEFMDALEGIARAGEIVTPAIGGLLICAALIYFLPGARTFAIALAAIVVASAVSGVYWMQVGRNDVEAQWKAANARAAAASSKHDASAEQQLEREFPPNQVNPDDATEAKILADLSAAASTSCQLGADSLRLRH